MKLFGFGSGWARHTGWRAPNVCVLNFKLNQRKTTIPVYNRGNKLRTVEKKSRYTNFCSDFKTIHRSSFCHTAKQAQWNRIRIDNVISFHTLYALYRWMLCTASVSTWCAWELFQYWNNASRMMNLVLLWIIIICEPKKIHLAHFVRSFRVTHSYLNGSSSSKDNGFSWETMRCSNAGAPCSWI